ncbi:MAG: hypothetical protein JJE19_08725, partial [Methanosarcinales archaeon]|nr:hypothetical protein [Methanosarcinales archaeon]
MTEFSSVDEFKNDLRKLRKKYGHIDEDLGRFCKVLSNLAINIFVPAPTGLGVKEPCVMGKSSEAETPVIMI